MNQNVLARISDAELSVLHVLWQEERALTMAQLYAFMNGRMDWDKSTIKTLVYRLVDKGAISVEKQYPALYSPIVSEQQYGQYATNVLIDKLYGGSARNLVAALVGTHALANEDIMELSKMFHVGE